MSGASLRERCLEERTRTWAGRDFYFGAGERSAGHGGGWIPPPAPCASVTFPPPFPGGASRAGRGEVGRGGPAVTSSPPPGGSARSLARAAGWGGDSGSRSGRRTEGRRHREAAPPPRPDRLRDPRGQEVGPRCSCCRRRLQSRCGAEEVSARRAGSAFSRASAPAGAARASSVGLLGCLSALRPRAPSSGPASFGRGCSGGG